MGGAAAAAGYGMPSEPTADSPPKGAATKNQIRCKRAPVGGRRSFTWLKKKKKNVGVSRLRFRNE